MKNLLYLIIVTAAPLCKSAEPLMIKRENLTAGSMRTDGYYYCPYETGYLTCFFYQNGVFYYPGYISNGSELTAMDDKLSRQALYRAKTDPLQYTWGIFKVQGSVIKVNRWVHGSGGEYPAQMLIGEIKNDSTIWFHTQIGDNTVGKRKKTFEIDETFRFRQFGPKPDSASPYIK